MDDEGRIVVSLSDEDDMETTEEPLVVALDPPVRVETGTLVVDLSTEATPQATAKNRRPFILAVSFVALLVIGMVVGYTWDRHTGATNPSTVELPKLTHTSATASAFDGPDANLVGLVTDAGTLVHLKSAHTCMAFAATSLSALGSPQKLLAEIDTIPDPSVSAAFGNVLGGVSGYLGFCDDRRNLTTSSSELRFATIVAHRFLVKLGIPIPKESK